MAFSSLICKEVIANDSNYSHYRDGNVCKITPHHMAGVLTGEQCARLFQDGNRNASANYCIGVNGDIVGNVPEEFRAWTSSDYYNDHHAITIEVSNDSYGGNWHVSDASWNSLVNLCVDICKRYNFRLVYDGTPNGSLTRHNMFAGTDCPGPYLQSRFQELANTVNARLDLENLKYEEIDKKSIVLKNDCSLWNLNFYNWNDAKEVKSYAKGTKIDNIVAIANHPLGGKYYITEYSYSNGIPNGFNVVDCNDAEFKQEIPLEEPKQENSPIIPTEPEKHENEQENEKIEHNIDEKEPINENKDEKDDVWTIICKILKYIVKLIKGDR